MVTVLYVLLALLMLGIMITVHELGHFLAARACGIAVRAFGIGFGPKLAHWTGRKHDTEYSIRLIPCGGFTAFYGEDDLDGETARNDPRSFVLQPAWKRLITVFCGPLMNFVLAFVVAACFFAVQGLPYAGDTVYTHIESVQPGSPAEQAGIRAGDLVIKANGNELNGDFTAYMDAYTGEGGVRLTLLRNGSEVETTVLPDYISTEGRYMIGVMITYTVDTVWQHRPFGETVGWAFETCVSAGGAILSALRDLLTTGEGVDQLSGPVGVVQIIAEQTREYQLMGYLNMLIVISINLGLVNLLPFPGLDGSRILFILFEIVFRRPVNRRVEAMIHTVGAVLLIALMLFFTFRDILRIVA